MYVFNVNKAPEHIKQAAEIVLKEEVGKYKEFEAEEDIDIFEITSNVSETISLTEYVLSNIRTTLKSKEKIKVLFYFPPE
jgi:hypothetical protein